MTNLPAGVVRDSNGNFMGLREEPTHQFELMRALTGLQAPNSAPNESILRNQNLLSIQKRLRNVFHLQLHLYRWL